MFVDFSRAAWGQLSVALDQYAVRRGRDGSELVEELRMLNEIARKRASEDQRGPMFAAVSETRESRPMTPSVLTYEQAATYLNVSHTQVKRLTRNGDLRVTSIGGARRLSISTLDAYIEDHTEARTP